VGCRLVEVVLVSCRGKVDNILPGIIELAVKKLRIAKMPHLMVALLEVIANSLYYNPLLALQVLESKGFTTEVFTYWFKLLNKTFKRRHEIKLTILAFSAIFHLPLHQWPPVLQSQTKTLVMALMELCKKYISLPEEADNSIDSSDLSDGEDDEDDEDNIDEEDEDNLQITTEEYKTIKKDLNEYKNKIYDEEEDVAPNMLNGAIMTRLAEFYVDASSESTKDSTFSSLLDHIDELLFFLEAFRVFSNKEPAAYQKLLQSFTPEEQVKLQALGDEANLRQSNKIKNT